MCKIILDISLRWSGEKKQIWQIDKEGQIKMSRREGEIEEGEENRGMNWDEGKIYNLR